MMICHGKKNVSACFRQWKKTGLISRKSAINKKPRMKRTGRSAIDTATGCVIMSGPTHYTSWTRMVTGFICQTASAPALRKAFVPKSINTAGKYRDKERGNRGKAKHITRTGYSEIQRKARYLTARIGDMGKL